MGGCKVLLSVAGVLLTVLAIAGQAEAVAMVMGNVFCDQCRDGQLSLFDLPIIGAKVELECRGQVVTTATTNYIGNYIMELDGTPDLSACSVKPIQSLPDSQCNMVGIPAKSLSLTFTFFGMEFYSVDPLFFYPAKTNSFCGRTLLPPTLTFPSPPSVLNPPPSAIFSSPPPAVFSPPPPAVFSPPPTSPFFSFPPLPPFQAPAKCLLKPCK